jgi:hypothetical protein
MSSVKMRWPALLALVLLPVAPLRAEEAAKPYINDKEGLFSEETKKQAEEKIAAIRAAYHRAVYVRTLQEWEIPAAVKKAMEDAAFHPIEAQKKFHELAVNLARNDNIDGIYILLHRGGRKDHPLIWAEVIAEPPNEHGTVFTNYSRTKVRNILRTQEPVIGIDRALLAALDEAEVQLRINSAPVNPMWVVMAWIFGATAVLLLVLFLIRIKLDARDRAAGVGTTGGAHPETPALAGHLFGTPAGGWIHDQGLHPPSEGDEKPPPQT